jgi:hypothetical protein
VALTRNGLAVSHHAVHNTVRSVILPASVWIAKKAIKWRTVFASVLSMAAAYATVKTPQSAMPVRRERDRTLARPSASQGMGEEGVTAVCLQEPLLVSLLG